MTPLLGIVIDHAQLSQPTPEDPHRYVAEASDLNLRPGEWPETIILCQDPFQNLAGHVFHRGPAHYNDSPDRELISVDYYTSQNQLCLEVYND